MSEDVCSQQLSSQTYKPDGCCFADAFQADQPAEIQRKMTGLRASEWRLRALLVLVAVSVSSSVSFGQGTAGWDSPAAIIPRSQRIEIKDQVEITSEIPGKIITLNPSARGEVVQKGDVVVELNSELIKKQLVELDAKAGSQVLIDYAEKTAIVAQKSMDIAEQMLKSKLEANEESGREIFSKDEILQRELEVIRAKAEVDKSQAELDKANEEKYFAELAAETKRAELAQYSIKSEIGGIVTDTHKKSVGAGVRQGDPILTIVNMDEVLAVLTVTPDYEDRINIGDTVLIRKSHGVANDGAGQGRRNFFGASSQNTASPASNPANDEGGSDETYVGTVTYIGPSSADQDNSMEIEAVIKNKQLTPGKYALREGASIQARIISPGR